MASRAHSIKGILVIAGLVFTAFSNTLDNAFVWDDVRIVASHPAIRPPLRPRAILSSRFLSFQEDPRAEDELPYWRPVILLSFFTDARAWGRNPFGFHLTNVFIHFLNASILFLLLSSLPSARAAALPASLLFALHPLQANAVSYISGRTDLFAAFFLLAALLLAFRSRSFGIGRTAIGSVLVLLALMSKESAIAAPLLFPLLGRLAEPGRGRRGITMALASCGALAVYFVIRSLAGLPAGGWLARAGAVSIPRLLAVSKSLVLYARLFLIPVGLRMERFIGIPPPGDPLGILAAAIVLLALAAAFRPLLRRGGGKTAPLFFFFSLAALLPAANIVPLYPAIAGRQIFIGEQFLYLPLAGLAPLAVILWGDIAERAGRRAVAVRAAGVALLAILGLLAHNHNEYWRDEAAFYGRTLARYPGSVRMATNLGLLRAREGRFEEGLALLSGVAEHNPRSARAHYNLGVAYLGMGMTDRAEEALRACLDLEPRHPGANSALGALEMSRDRTDEAIGHYRAAIADSPHFTEARLGLATAYFRQERVDEAAAALREALALDPLAIEVRYFLAVILERQGLLDDARIEYREILRRYPDCAPAEDRLRGIEGD
ncbi:MAG: tetratricopeptide repeat protein [bacterium]|nr:tetratricopeptide repeat protein [bacterium]